MIEAASFVEAARKHGFTRYTGVPCSFLTPFINYVINDPTLSYISSANEGDALATAAGCAIGGQRAVVMMQNSGLGNAVSPLTSLTWVFRIPVLLIVTHRGAPDIHDEPQHELMGRITTQMLDTIQTPWEYFPDRESEIDAVLGRAITYMQRERRPYALVMKKGTVAPHALRRDPVPAKNNQTTIRQDHFNAAVPLPSRGEALERVMRHCPEADSVIIASTGFTGRELYAAADRRNHFYMVGSMGCASSLGLGLALARPDRRIVILDGDGAALMRLGNLATIGTYGGGNLYHVLLDNCVHDSTGAQATVSPNVDFAAIAAACGYGIAIAGNRLEVIEDLFSGSGSAGPRFAHLRIAPGTIANLPRPAVTPVQALDRLMQHLESEF
jgi:phosphonopyruvate decarboxylase